MIRRLYIDGNNLLHAMRASAPVANVGRETMVRLIEKWVAESGPVVTLVFDGPPPRGAMAAQIKSKTLSVQFSAPRTADDVLIDAIHACSDPAATGVVTADTAILHEAGARRCQRISPAAFIESLFRKPADEKPVETPRLEKPSAVSAKEAQELLDLVEEAYDESDLDDFDACGL